MLLFNLPISLPNLLFLAEVALHKMWMKLRGKERPSSSPYISGDSFRAIASHVYVREGFNTAAVRKGESVFVDFADLEHFLREVHPYISTRYILLSHNGDLGIDRHFLRYIDAHLLAWFTQNALVKHPKLIPIPIGLENLSYYNHGVPSFFVQHKEKIAKIIYGFSVSTNPKIRSVAQKKLKRIASAQKIQVRLNSRQYFKELSRYMFVASPPGNGEDCIRTWEAMYMHVVPIVQRSVLTSYFEKLKLPLWVIDDWNELAKYDEKALQKKYATIQKNSDRSPLFMRYWKARIEHYGR